MPLQQILPTWLALNACNDQSASYFFDLRTQQPVNAGGLNLGDYFDLTSKEALQLSYTTTGTLYAGRYRRVRVDSGATAAEVKTGTIGLMISGGQPGINTVTSYDKGIVGCHPVVFLNAITPGNYGFTQELGIATVLCGSSITKSGPNTGDLLNSTTAGVVDDPTTQSVVPESVAIALAVPIANALILCQLRFAPILQD